MNVNVKDYESPNRLTTIQVLYPDNNSATEKQEIGVVASVHAGEPIRTVTVSVNDEIVKQLDLGRQGNRSRDIIPLEVPTPLNMGNNRITIAAITAEGESIYKTIDVKRIKPVETVSAKAIGKRWAVVIGISAYLNAENGIPPLQYAHRDAIALMDL